ncbi:MDR family MFS transporter [Limobrevibacterium gyesilva]|uniref:MFS transporter n=1 Tax=Limobrevibacterium gyesilva TaxID=2991712 RepID=A0AA42CGX2_9PROT|nr:MDR family MFS transporter [Limobrevibacterium gyesilva]MCW3474275.1 MFS transporter [Limobrevibacterium gyesilva]
MDAPPPTLPAQSATIEPADADALPAFSHQQIVQVLTGILLCILLAAIDQTVVVPAVPAIAADLNGFGHLSWIVSAYLLTSTSSAPVYGKLSDIYGRRALLLPAIVVFVIASILCALSQSLFQLIVFRALQGLGGGGLMAMAQAAIADVVAPRERGKYQGYMAGTWGVASIFGPILGGWMTDYLSWHWIFWINVPIGIAAFFLSSRALKLLKVRRTTARVDYLGAALLTGFITTCLLMMSWGGVEYSWVSPEITGMGGLALALLAALIWQERRYIDPLLPPRLFTNSVFSLGVMIAFLATAGMLGGTFLLPLFFQLIGGVDASASGTMIVPFLGFNVVGAYVSGQLARRLGRAKGIVLGGLAASCVGFLLLATATGHTPGPVLVLYMAVVGLGIGLCMPSSLVIVQNAAERRDVGAATGALLFLRSMGGAFGSTLAGALLTGHFTQRLAELGVTQSIDLGALRGAEGATLVLDEATRTLARTALSGGFHLTFLVCAGLSAIAVLACLFMRDLPLQSGAK